MLKFGNWSAGNVFSASCALKSYSVSWQDHLNVVLVETRNPLNIGAAARAMLNFGFSRLTLVSPYDVAFREARSAAGAASVLKSAIVVSTIEEAVAGCSLIAGTASAGRRIFRQPRHPLPEAALMLRSHLTRHRAALLFGSEKFGLSNSQLSHCHWTLRIPTNPGCPSMNLGQAVALCCYELARGMAARPRERGDRPEEAAEAGFPNTAARGAGARADAAQLARIVERLTGALDASGYINARTRSSNVLKIRRLVARLQLSARDAQVVEGMVRQIGWRLARDNMQSDR